MNKQQLRAMIIHLLNDDHGVNSSGHDGLLQICAENGWEDINKATEIYDNRFFLCEEDAEALLATNCNI